MKKCSILFMIDLIVIFTGISCCTTKISELEILHAVPDSFKVFLFSDRTIGSICKEVNPGESYNVERSADGNTICIITEKKLFCVGDKICRTYSRTPNSFQDWNGNVIAYSKEKTLVFPSGHKVILKDIGDRFDFTPDGCYYYFQRDGVTNLFSVKTPEEPILTISNFEASRFFSSKNIYYLSGTQGLNQRGIPCWKILKLSTGSSGKMVVSDTISLPNSPLDIAPDGKTVLLDEEFVLPLVFGHYLTIYDVSTGKKRFVPCSIGSSGIFVTPALWDILRMKISRGKVPI